MKSEFTLSKHRFYELKHFCLQYPDWEMLYKQLDGWPEEISKNEGDTTSRDGIRRADLMSRIQTVKAAADECAEYRRDILEFVTQNHKPEEFSGEFWYYYRKFFWVLDKIRN